MRRKVVVIIMDQSQLLRGTLEGCILKIISLKATYGYEISVMLQQYGFQNMKEGTLYPLLLRLEKRQLIIGVFRPSPLGPSRKYFFITDAGRAELKDFTVLWKQTFQAVEAVLALEKIDADEGE